MTERLRRWLPTNAWVRVAIVPALVFIALATERNYFQDFWHHLARGRAMVEQGRIVDQDLFTCTVPGIAFQDVNWLTQIGYHFLFNWGGLDLVQLANAALLALAFAWLVLFCRRVSGSTGIAAAVGVITFFGLWQVLTLRPQTLSLLLFVILYDVLDRSERQPWWLLVPPVLLALWANLHGAFPGGLLLIGCFVATAGLQAWHQGAGLLRDRRLRWLALCLAASVAATALNPYGPGIYQFVGNTSMRASARRIDEWVPTSLDQWVGVAFFASLVWLGGLFAAAWWRGGRRPAVRELCLIACFLPLAFGSVRMVMWWLLVIAPVSAALLARLLPARTEAVALEERRPSLGAGIVFTLILLAVVFCLPPLQPLNPLLRVSRSGPRTEETLEEVHRHLRRTDAAGNIFSRFEWAAYLSYAAAPDYKIFMDVRIDMYPDQVWEEYTRVTLGEQDWQEILDRYRVNYLLLDAEYHQRTGLLPRVEQSEQWQRTCQAGDAVLFVRRPTGQAKLIPRHTPAVP